jgi:hypothetical protein
MQQETIFWELFKATGYIGAYMLYKRLTPGKGAQEKNRMEQDEKWDCIR